MDNKPLGPKDAMLVIRDDGTVEVTVPKDECAAGFAAALCMAALHAATSGQIEAPTRRQDIN